MGVLGAIMILFGVVSYTPYTRHCPLQFPAANRCPDDVMWLSNVDYLSTPLVSIDYVCVCNLNTFALLVFIQMQK